MNLLKRTSDIYPTEEILRFLIQALNQIALKVSNLYRSIGSIKSWG